MYFHAFYVYYMTSLIRSGQYDASLTQRRILNSLCESFNALMILINVALIATGDKDDPSIFEACLTKGCKIHLEPLLSARQKRLTDSPFLIPCLTRFFTSLFQHWPRRLEVSGRQPKAPTIEAYLRSCATRYEIVRKALMESLVALGLRSEHVFLSGGFLFDLTA